MAGFTFDQGRLGEFGVPYIIQNTGHVVLSLRRRYKKMGNTIHKVIDVVSLPCMHVYPIVMLLTTALFYTATPRIHG